MNFIDLLILAVLGFFAVKGVMRGLVNEAASLTALVARGWLAYRFHPILAAPIRNLLHMPVHLCSFMAFIIILLVTGISAQIVGGIATAALRLVMLGSLNRLGGLIIGCTEGVLLLCMVFSIASSSYMPEKFREKIQATESARFLAETGDHFLSEVRSTTGPKK